ncbi:M20/M25/M40 family metallo-hydrolase [Lysinibacillus yapensis]|uniref:M20/M25/M40 family metallo-hydrolase n=1 Tax=Ureibacillus yapensis TaxID=2304605 RepID=A0A396SDM6_9BACL|nr:M20/M25/M40 family metallo-hydrolase [Lysinibacillus yapensis]RHW35914.1 M20/M25/M40 family metallo-hydrolase [Lysinibacillus yapensis]
MATVSVMELMTRYGFVLEMEEGNCRLKNSNEENEKHYADVVNMLAERGISLVDEMLESDFIEILESLFESTGEMLFSPEELAIHTVDLYVRGLVMQLNRLGLATTFSCDGHDARNAKIFFSTIEGAKEAQTVLQHAGLASHRNNLGLVFRVNREELPLFAGRLANITSEEVDELWEKANPLMKKPDFYSLLEELLSIYGVSGEEETIREFVVSQLKQHVDYLEVDHYGNVLAQVRKGNGPTVLLNAHLDTVDYFMDGRKILKNGSIWSSSEGVLGADDRAGVCVLLAVAKSLENSAFQGTVKFAFTVEEEIGLVGAKRVAKSFLWDVDMAFVVDRRGTGDIVTSCGGYIPFCSDSFARKVEQIGHRVHRNRWHAVKGGSSDTRIWAEQGINSINLSVGYQHEHTEYETVDIEATYGTYELVAQLLEESRTLTKRQLEQRIRNRATTERCEKIK